MTPELAGMCWPEGTRLAAFDRCPGMIAEIWPGAAVGGSAGAVRADWRALPVADASFDVVIGDGCYTLVDSVAGYRAVGDAVARALAPGGAYVMRFFVRPGTAERVDDVFAALREGRIGSFHVFKWRLAMALHGSLDEARELLALHFVEESCVFGSYELGERCPTLQMRRRARLPAAGPPRSP